MEYKTPKTSKAMREAISRYQEKFERVNCRLDMGTTDRVKKLGYASMNSFIRLAVAEKLAHDEELLNKKP